MGWDINRFVDYDEIDRELLCPICTDVLDDPVQTECDHNFCRECIIQWLSNGNANNVCPTDMRPLAANQLKQASRIITNFIDRLIIRCQNYDNGCTFTTKFENMTQLTEHQNVQCPHGLICKEIETLKAENKKLKEQTEKYKKLWNEAQFEVKEQNRVIDDLQNTCASLRKELHNEKENNETLQKCKIAKSLEGIVREQEETSMKNLLQLKEIRSELDSLVKSKDSFEICVKNDMQPLNNACHTLIVNPSDRMSNIKSMVCEKTGIPIDELLLNLGEKPVYDYDKTVNEYKIKDHSTVHFKASLHHLSISLLPRVWFDVTSSGLVTSSGQNFWSRGRIVMELRSDVVPKTSEHFRVLCTGEKGYGFAKSIFRPGNHSIYIGNNRGDVANHNGASGQSTYGPPVENENFILKHTGPGTLSINTNPNTNQTRFFICTTKASELDGTFVVFGSVVEGMDVIKEIDKHLHAFPTSAKIEISSSGQFSQHTPTTQSKT